MANFIDKAYLETTLANVKTGLISLFENYEKNIVYPKYHNVTTVSVETMNNTNATCVHGRIYDFGTLSASDSLNITYSIVSGGIYHAKFKAGNATHTITLTASDGNTIEVKKPTTFEIGKTYEISMIDYVAVIG